MGNQFWKTPELFGPLFCISILKFFKTQTIRHSLHFNVFCMTQEKFFLQFLHIKEGGSNISGEPIMKNVWIIWSLLLYFNFKIFLDPNYTSFITLKCILHDSGEIFPESWNFYISRREDLISGVNQLWKMSELFGPSFCISILKVLWTHVLHHSLDFNALCMIQEYFCHSVEVFRNQRVGT